MRARARARALLLLFPLLCAAVAAVAVSGAPLGTREDGEDRDAAQVFSKVYVHFGQNVGAHVALRAHTLLRSVESVATVELESEEDVRALLVDGGGDEGEALLLLLGNSTVAMERFLDADTLAAMGPEAFVLKGSVAGAGKRLSVLAGNGNAMEMDGTPALDTSAVHVGAIYAVYSALQELGFAFLQPLQPIAPDMLALPHGARGVDLEEKPYWRFRGFHVHTQHPLELTEVLQGFDIPMFGPVGPHCRDSSSSSSTTASTSTNAEHAGAEVDADRYCERWEDMVSGVDHLFEWAAANRLNKIEWLLLGNVKWGDMQWSEQRQDRIKVLTEIGHSYGLLTGADVPIAEQQQHAWYMVSTRDSFDQQVADIHTHVDWIFGAGFDFITTESGLSEFTHPDCTLMLDLMNEFADYVNGTYGREATIKVHCSTGQYCDDYPDPRTGEPINFNFLPTYATDKLGVCPHTVQAYALDDPTAGSYGNDNFSAIADYMYYEMDLGVREIEYYPETAYWVNVDVDVPLFLPVYGQRRLHDLRSVAQRQLDDGKTIGGQMNFDSGWEWGYWVSDVITARANWNPFLAETADEDVALRMAMQPITYALGISIGPLFEDFIADLSEAQYSLLIMGEVDGQPSPNLDKLSGFAYLSGDDTWVDLPRNLGMSLTQPDKVHMDETDDPDYEHVAPLLEEMESTFGDLGVRMDAILSQAQDAAAAGSLNNGMVFLVEEVADAVRMLAYRAKQVRMLYASRSPTLQDESEMERLWAQSREVIADALAIVESREAKYRVPWERIASWREYPTSYRYGYVWAVHSLYYWWRDQGLAEGGSLMAERSPCYLNRIDSTDVAVGVGKYALELLRLAVNKYSPHENADMIINCVAPPPTEYEFPRDLFRY